MAKSQIPKFLMLIRVYFIEQLIIKNKNRLVFQLNKIQSNVV